MKENQIRELVNELRDIAIEYHGTQQLREQIARTVRAAIIQAGNSPVIGIDMASEPDRSVEVRYLAPPGYVMVPKVVTPEIGNAINEVGQRCTCGNCSQRLWDLLLASAPVQVDIEMLASALKNAPLAPSDNQGRPRAPVVPPAIEPDYKVIKSILPTANPDEYACTIAADMWNACRAAMLQGGQPVSNRDELQVIGWLRSDYNSDDKRDPNAPLFMLGSNDPSDAWGVKYIPLSGNSPVIPGGWISCSERMPDREYVLAGDFSGTHYLASIPNVQVGIYADWFDDEKPCWDDGDGNDLHLKEVTHWMPLPEPPQEVNRG